MSTEPVPAAARRATLALFDTIGAFETTPDGGWDYVTPAFTRLLGGLPESSLLGREWISRVHPDEVQRVLAEYRQAREWGRPWTMQFRMIDADGVPVWVSVNASPLPTERGGRGIAYMGLVKDVTPSKQAEERARASERTVVELAEFVETGLVITRSDHILAANTAATRLLGADTPDELIGRPVVEFLLPGEAREYELRDQSAGDINLVATVVPMHGGKPTLVAVHGRGITYAGAPARVVSAVPVDDPHIQLATEDRNFRRLQALESLLPLAYHRVSIEGDTFGQVEYASPLFAALLGYRPEQLIGRSVLEFTHPDHREASRLGMTAFSQRDGRVGTIHRKWVHADGSDVHLALDICIYRDPVTGHAVSMALSRRLDPDSPEVAELPSH